jgi:Fic family protein
MNIEEKLKKIIISGYTQQKISIELGVSFATVNSWINSKSVPRKKHIEKISSFYEYIFGLDDISEEQVNEKFNKIIKLKDKNLFKDIIKNKELLNLLILKVTYNTNSIEGSTLTEYDTDEIIFSKKVLKKHSLVEHLEAKNHKDAFIFCMELVKKKKVLKSDILEMHRILMSGILDNAGFFRNHPVRILGSGVPTANFLKIDDLIEYLVKKMNTKFSIETSIKSIAKFHAEFEKIHPFSDGNGRIGRLLMLVFSLKNNLPPVVILKERKKAYYKYLREAQLKDNNIFLEDFIFDSILEGAKILKL